MMLKSFDAAWSLTQTTTKEPLELIATAGEYCLLAVEVLTWKSDPTGVPSAVTTRAWIESPSVSVPPEE